MGGFELLALYDFPGQGTALVGVLDALWNPKGYITAGEFRRFCNSTVPLARLPRRVFTTDQVLLEVALEVAHFGPRPLVEASLAWKLVADDGKAVASGRRFAPKFPVDNGVSLGSVTIPLRDLSAPARYRLVAGLEATPFENDWDVWVDDFTLGLLCNDEVIDVDQDSLGRPGRRVAKDQKLEVWAKDMEDGSRAVGLFNRGESAATVTAQWADLGLAGPRVVRDLRRQKDLGQFDGRFGATVPRHGVVLVRISRLP